MDVMVNDVCLSRGFFPWCGIQETKCFFLHSVVNIQYGIVGILSDRQVFN